MFVDTRSGHLADDQLERINGSTYQTSLGRISRVLEYSGIYMQHESYL